MNGKAIETAGALSSERAGDVAFRAMLCTLGLVERVMQPYFAKFGITGSQWGVLRVLHRAEAEGLPGLRLTDLSERLIIRPPSVTGVVDRLQRLGMVVREGMPDDLRARQVTLTPKARRLIERMMNGHGGQIDNIMGGLSRDEQTHFQRLLLKLNGHLDVLAKKIDSGIGGIPSTSER
ncbi:MAG TPA: MarR family transcriptional regulator [Tepidisphaeraceae bacterium]|jgi:DNA-binding MarR family transcriptional regulator|nr:MarR family transcriptional regulator [Tepidisphaeraceae bacterium]